MSTRKTRLVDCHPRWARDYSCAEDAGSNWISFDCPEGHPDCTISVPFTPALDGSARANVGGRALWSRTGGTFETLTLSPSILMRPTVTRSGRVVDPCALHIHVTNGQITFCGDSR